MLSALTCFAAGRSHELGQVMRGEPLGGSAET